MTVAAERPAVIAAITLALTAVSSILGMNLIVDGETRPLELAIAMMAMVARNARAEVG